MNIFVLYKHVKIAVSDSKSKYLPKLPNGTIGRLQPNYPHGARTLCRGGSRLRLTYHSL